MPLAPGQAISNSRVFWAAGGSGGSGPGQSPPFALGPLPSVGAEGDSYAYQINAFGALPMTFNIVDGALPQGKVLSESSGVISGTTPYPYGGLYTFTVEIANAYGSIQQEYQMLITGTAATFTQDWTYPIAQIGTGFSGMTNDPQYFSSYVGTFVATESGVDTASASVPATWEFVSSQDPALPTGVTFNELTGETEGSPTDPAQLCDVFQYGVIYRNYFGYHQENYTMVVIPTIYWGEWYGAVPGTFTAANIQTDLYDDATPGPRIIPGYDGVFGNAAFAGASACNGSPEYFRFPDVTPARARVLAVPKKWFTGTVNGGVTNWTASIAFTPTFPTPYQENLALTVNGISVLYDIFVTAPTTSGPWLFFTANQPPTITTDSGYTEYLTYIGDSEYRPKASEDNKSATLQVVTSSGIPYTYSTSGSLPTGMTWDSMAETITGAPTSNADIGERFFFSITATNAYGSRTLDLTIVVSAPLYFGELSGAIPGTFTESDITTGLYNGTTPGPRVYPGDGTNFGYPGTFWMSPMAIGIAGVVLPSFYSANTADAWYPGQFKCPLTAGITTRVFAVPTKFFSGSWSQDPYGTGATRTYTPYVQGLYGSTGTAAFNPAWPTPYQTGLSITVNGIACTYNIFVLEGSSGLVFRFN